MIPVLRHTTKEGAPYERPSEVQATLEELYALPIEEVAERAQSTREGQEGFVPSECVLHFVRQSKKNGDTAPYQTLFEVLRRRAAALAPVRYQKNIADQEVPTSRFEEEVQEKVLDALLGLICKDREEYSKRLDFFEIRFNMAVSRLRSTARKSVGTRRGHEQQADYEENSPSLTQEMENRLASVQDSLDPEKNFFRFELRQAIGQLPADQRRVIELLHLEGFPIEAKEHGALSVSKLLQCTSRTVRNRRDGAYARLKEILGDDWS